MFLFVHKNMFQLVTNLFPNVLTLKIDKLLSIQLDLMVIFMLIDHLNFAKSLYNVLNTIFRLKEFYFFKLPLK